MLPRPEVFSARVTAAQSTREGGVSEGPFSSLNLGLSVGDDKEFVRENRRRFYSALGFSPEDASLVHQVHGAAVIEVGTGGYHEGYDAQITNARGVLLVVSVADCVPLLIHDEEHDAIAAIHAGWRGTVARITEHTLSRMGERYGTDPSRCKIFIGACIGPEHFETGEEVALQFPASVRKFSETAGKWFVDLKAANREQLLSLGVHASCIEVSPHCTYADSHLFFSHRRERGLTGRMQAAIGIR